MRRRRSLSQLFAPFDVHVPDVPILERIVEKEPIRLRLEIINLQRRHQPVHERSLESFPDVLSYRLDNFWKKTREPREVDVAKHNDICIFIWNAPHSVWGHHTVHQPDIAEIVPRAEDF